MIDIDFGEKNPEWRHGAPAEDWMDGAVEEDSDEGESGDRIPDGTEKLRFVCLVPDEFGRFQGGTAYFGPDDWHIPSDTIYTGDIPAIKRKP